MRILRVRDIEDRVCYACLQADGSLLEIMNSIYSEKKELGSQIELKEILSPLKPSNIIGIGLNYRKHAEELGLAFPKFPVVFYKQNSSIQDPNLPIRLPSQLKSEKVDYEGELAIVIGKKCFNATQENALDYVLGYTIANDVSARDWQMEFGGSQWCRGKSFDTFCPLGPAIVTKDVISNPDKLKLSTFLNDNKVQESNTEDMIFSVPEIIEFLSADTTLEPGTVILTGTPEGVGQSTGRFLQAGDHISVEIENIGRIDNPVQ
ncbi:fumarylacetoacetate hydrolase family protein [Aureibacter tunicatorum]|uniref:2-keto-4-pentenoate hydratase/2-oxohepta-3-ene-1,7-dioic acid hydratase in catechol pathway n=1 Tax=Aureibacter tunicatorum TaxID=866807 RepID=A0AAE3XMY1_9BACT|nr:fumarylacetoacetate hydrolase family protein [Aureibacter tunicatorum]MDR6239422.1 2-keto-4-pentenoate hydratase/2-oxohepta-3-ene-1,7-dioic acid hydratase in catechol pathway [Aureibacter tunicatorum]BDD04655.1 hypothetical protein AUTU_21380 [Aureibacter tunicatorum]